MKPAATLVSPNLKIKVEFHRGAKPGQMTLVSLHRNQRRPGAYFSFKEVVKPIGDARQAWRDLAGKGWVAI